MKLFLSFLLFCGLSLSAQEVFSLEDLEVELAVLGERVIKDVTESERLAAHEAFDALLYEMLQHDEAYEFAFDKVKNLSKITAESDEFRLFTWLVPLKDGTYQYHGYAMMKKKKGLEIAPLLDASLTLEKPEYAWLKPSKWYGAIYYQTFEVKHKKNRYQIFLGYRPGNRNVQEKIVEVVQLEGNRLMFGAKIFDTPRIFDYQYEQRPYRLRFRYAKKVVASVKYNPSEKMIIMDHLSPPDASMQKQWQYYGPDFSYDGLLWEEGKFVLKSQISFETELSPFVPQNAPQQGLAPKKQE